MRIALCWGRYSCYSYTVYMNMRFALVAFVAACSASSTPPVRPLQVAGDDGAVAKPRSANCSDGIKLADKALERDVRRRTGIEAPAAIRTADVARLYAIGGKLEIESLAGIECLTALESLRFRTYDSTVDLQPLESLTTLERLRIDEASVASLAPLAKLHRLERLELLVQPHHDLTALASLRNLEYLALWSYDGQTIDLGPLAALPNLSRVEIFPKGVTAVVPAGAVNLAEAVWGQQGIDTAAACPGPVHFADRNLEAAVRTAIAKPPDAAIEPGDLVSVRSLPGRIKPVASLAGIECLTHLARLRVAPASPMLDLAPLAALNHLRELRLVLSAIGDVRALAKLDQLRALRLRVTGGTDLTPIAQLRRLARLKLNMEGTVDLGFLRSLSRLRRLEFVHARNIDLRALAPLQQLRSLRITGVGVLDLSTLAHLPRLKRLSLEVDDLPDLRPLTRLPRLEWLSINIRSARKPQADDIAVIERLQRLTQWTFTVGNVSCSGSRGRYRADAPWRSRCTP